MSDLLLFCAWPSPQVFGGPGGRGGQERDVPPQRPAGQLAARLPGRDSRRSGAHVQQSQRPVPRLHMEPHDQQRVSDVESLLYFYLHKSGLQLSATAGDS